MLEALFKTKTKELVLLYLYTYQEGYAQEIRKLLDLPLRSVQLQLKAMEEGGVLVCKRRDRTIVYQLNLRYPFYKELTKLLEKALLIMPEKDRKKYFTPRLRPRRLGKEL